jgi:hypothetical protein
MADEPQSIVLVMLRDIRAKQDEHSAHFQQIEARLGEVEKQLDDYRKIVRYSFGQTVAGHGRALKSNCARPDRGRQ